MALLSRRFRVTCCRREAVFSSNGHAEVGIATLRGLMPIGRQAAVCYLLTRNTTRFSSLGRNFICLNTLLVGGLTARERVRSTHTVSAF